MSSSWKIPLHRPELVGNELHYVEDALQAGEWAWGGYIERAEELLREITGAKYVVCVDSGTDALELAIRHGMTAKPGDGIIIPDLTFAATGMAVLRAGCVPIIVDVDEMGMLDPISCSKVKSAASSAIEELNPARSLAGAIPVDLLGRAADPAFIKLFGKVVWDAAESLGAIRHKEPVGASGTSCFSFNGNKVVSGGGGGAIATDDQGLADLLRYARNQGQDADGAFAHIGGNHRMSNLHAAVLSAQLEEFGTTLALKKIRAQHYTRLFRAVEGIECMGSEPCCQPNEWLYPIKVGIGRVPMIIEALAEQRIEARRMFSPLHREPVFILNGAYVKGPYPRSRQLYETVVLLPSGLGVVAEDQEWIARIVETALNAPMEKWRSKADILS